MLYQRPSDRAVTVVMDFIRRRVDRRMTRRAGLDPEHAQRVRDLVGWLQDTQGSYERPAIDALLVHVDPQR